MHTTRMQERLMTDQRFQRDIGGTAGINRWSAGCDGRELQRQRTKVQKGTTDIAQKTVEVKSEADTVTDEVGRCDQTAQRLTQDISVFVVD